MDKWKPSKARAIQFAQKMNDIETFCQENGITKFRNGDSYYFILYGKRYRVSNHTVKSSNSRASNQFGQQIRDKYHIIEHELDVIDIYAGKTRIIEIYSDLKRGIALDKRGNRI